MSAVGYHHPRGAGYVLGGRRGKRHEITEPGDLGGLGVLTERYHVVFRAHDQQRGRRDLVILVADRLLVDHLEGQRRRAGPAMVIRAERHPHQDVGQRLPYLRVGMHEVPFDVAADDRRVGPVHFVVKQRLLGLRGMPVL